MYVIIIFNNVFMFSSDTLVTPPVISNIPFMITERVLFKCNISFIKMVKDRDINLSNYLDINELIKGIYRSVEGK